MRFLVVTIRDMVGAQRRLVEHLGVRKIAMVAGGSIGGQQALEWAVSYPELVEKVIVVAATAALTAQAIAFNEVQQQAIMADRRWQKGNYRPGEGYASLEAALRRVRSKALLIGIRSDLLFPAARVRCARCYLFITRPSSHLCG